MISPHHVHACTKCGMLSVCLGQESINEIGEDYDCSRDFENECCSCFLEKAKCLCDIFRVGKINRKHEDSFIKYLIESK